MTSYKSRIIQPLSLRIEMKTDFPLSDKVKNLISFLDKFKNP